ncbi:class F sortase [Streptomyces sp. NBC_00335]|uniref:class F sortase n=1 Tax=unclassified Streptomyces TaxID=2593676 RepID=UPI00225055EE|nr:MULTISPECIES: class F sortase [unclassified Streptomyces]MCX5404053.1 class F sortase [Streptomyces sp. NBC_00086]
MPDGRRWGNRTIGSLTALAAAVGVWLITTDDIPQPPPQPTRAQGLLGTQHRVFDQLRGESRGGSSAPTPTSTPQPAAMAPAEPERIRVPSLRIDAPLTGLGLESDGSLQAPPPDGKNLAGWYAGGTSPGADGTAVVASHVDNKQGPAVFYQLGALKKGERIEVARRDGTTAVFTVDAIEVHDREGFPDQQVYGATGRPELRLITCGGTYTKKTGYPANVVVYAHLTDTPASTR